MTGSHLRIRPNGQRGQVMILFAGALIAMVAVVGLAVDGGIGYFDQRGLQAAADTSSDSGARMLLADAETCFASTSRTTSLPFTDAEISQVVGEFATTLSHAGSSRTQSYTATYTTSSGAQYSPPFVVGATSISQFCVPSHLTGTTYYNQWQDPNDTNLPGPSGVEVSTQAGHHTVLLQVVGIPNMTETATATSAFAVNNGGASDLFTSVFENCLVNPATSLEVGDTVEFWNNADQWGAANCNVNTTNGAGFKGDIRHVIPDPFKVPDWVQVQPGNGNIVFPPKNATILMPVICDPGAPPTGVSACPPNSPSPCPADVTFCGTGHINVYLAAFIAVQTSSQQCKKSDHTCSGQVVDVPGLSPSSIYCYTVPGYAPQCPSGLGAFSAGTGTSDVQLLN